jgi:hypothetical protein
MANRTATYRWFIVVSGHSPLHPKTELRRSSILARKKSVTCRALSKRQRPFGDFDIQKSKPFQLFRQSILDLKTSFTVAPPPCIPEYQPKGNILH